MTDYTGNSKKGKGEVPSGPPKPPVQVTKIVQGEAYIKKKTLGQKFKETFLNVDMKDISKHVLLELVAPMARNLVFDTGNEIWHRVMFKGQPSNRMKQGWTPYSQMYQNPGQMIRPGMFLQQGTGPMPQGWRDPSTRPPRGTLVAGGPLPQNPNRMQLVFSLRVDADNCLKMMNEVIDQAEYVAVADVRMMMGHTPEHTDFGFGWKSTADAQIIPDSQGVIIDLPQPEPVGQR